MTFLLSNFLISFVSIIVFFLTIWLFIWLIGFFNRNVFVATLPIVIVAAAFLSFQKSGPKFVLTDQVAPKQVSESSEIKTSGRKKLTDAERLRYNQTLINENQKFYRRGH